MKSVLYCCCLPKWLSLKLAITSHVTNPGPGQLDRPHVSAHHACLPGLLPPLGFPCFVPSWLPFPFLWLLLSLLSSVKSFWEEKASPPLIHIYGFRCHFFLGDFPSPWPGSVSGCQFLCPSTKSEQRPCPHRVSNEWTSSKAGASGMAKRYVHLELYPKPLTKADPPKKSEAASPVQAKTRGCNPALAGSL